MKNLAYYPFAAVVGQESLKQALLLALVNPRAGGLLIGGRRGTAKSVLARAAAELAAGQRLCTLPLNITEDMLFGSIDIEQAVSRGEKRFAPGLLSRADGNILYIDEINLLRQELLTAVLNINAAGVNQVERDGISHREEVSFTVIGTMNPEEGTFPAHFLDRFGMYAEAEALTEPEQRAEIIRRVLRFERDPQGFAKAYAEQTEALQRQVAQARLLLPQIRPAEAMLLLAAQMCAQGFCAGHRAELYLLEAAKAAAALAGRTYVLPGDLEAAAVYVLPHRMRRPPEEDLPPREEQESQQDADADGTDDTDDNNDADGSDETPESEAAQNNLPPDAGNDGSGGENGGQEQQDAGKDDRETGQLAPEEQTAAVDKSFPMPRLLLELGQNRQKRRGSGKRSLTRTDLKQGRYVRAELPSESADDLAFDATIRAAAPYQRLRGDNGCALNIQKSDLRQKIREKRIGSTFLFAVDASGSMGARERMSSVKGAIFCILQEAYQKRDRVGMLAFRREQAEVLLPFTRSVDLAQKSLAQLPTGGKTPLAEGLAAALAMLGRLNKHERELEPVLVLVTDGRANAKTAGSDPVAAALKAAEQIRKAKITAVVIDTEHDFIRLGIAQKLAAAMGASYYTLKKLSKESIIHIVRNLGNEV